MPAGADASKTDTTQHDKKLFEAVRRLVDRRIPGSMVTGKFRDVCGLDCVASIIVSVFTACGDLSTDIVLQIGTIGASQGGRNTRVMIVALKGLALRIFVF